MLKSRIYFGNIRESGHIAGNTGLCIRGGQVGEDAIIY